MKQVLIAIDQLLNTFCVWLPGGCWADETLSARAWRIRDQSKLHLWIDRLFFWDTDHCRESYDSEATRRQLPVEYRK